MDDRGIVTPEPDLEAMWKPALRGFHGHTRCDAENDALKEEIKSLEGDTHLLDDSLKSCEEENNALKAATLRSLSRS